MLMLRLTLVSQPMQAKSKAYTISLRNPDFLGQHIHGSQREDSHAHGRTGHAVDHLVDGSIATGGDEGVKPLVYGLEGNAAGVAGMRGSADFGARVEGPDVVDKTLGLLATGSRIQDDERLIHTSLSMGKA